MRLRDGNIIVCDCRVELNPKITTDHDFITYDAETKTAICSNCESTGVIEIPTPEVCPTCGAEIFS